ncbi:PadR family transcriptional regulator [Thermodesulfobacteriota bacterium]
MDVQTIILGFLMKKRMTGYELKKAFSISFSFFSGLSYGSIYPALKKMEQNGLIGMRLKVQKNAPNRKIYTITNKGKAQFKSSLKTPFAPERFKSSFLSHLFFFAHLSREERAKVSDGYLRVILDQQEQLEAIKSDVESVADPFQRFCFQFGLRFFQDLANNVSETIQSIEVLEQ